MMVESLYTDERIRGFDSGVRLYRPGLERIDVCQLLEMIAAAANVAEREGCDLWKLVLNRHVPSQASGWGKCRHVR